jgi:hypothetical protein
MDTLYRIKLASIVRLRPASFRRGSERNSAMIERDVALRAAIEDLPSWQNWKGGARPARNSQDTVRSWYDPL